MQINKIYFGEDKETLLVQFDSGEVGEFCSDGHTYDPKARKPSFWTEVPLPPDLKSGAWTVGPGHMVEMTGACRTFTEEVPPPFGERLHLIGTSGTAYWWNGTKWCLRGSDVPLQNWPPPAEDGPWIEVRGSMSADHICGSSCVCPSHPDLPMYYSGATGEHACQDALCADKYEMEEIPLHRESPGFSVLRGLFDAIEAAKLDEYKPLPTRRERRLAARASFRKQKIRRTRE